MKRTGKAPVVFIVDDDRDLLTAISQSVGSLSCTVRAFSSAEICLQALAREPCDLLISDVRMPVLDGLELLHRARRLVPSLAVLMMSGFADVPMAVQAVKEGALDMLEKPLDETTLLPAVQAVLDRLQREGRPQAALGEIEQRVLMLVAQGKTNKEIAYELGRSIRTVENHRYRLMKKLGVESTAGLVKVAVAIGLVKG